MAHNESTPAVEYAEYQGNDTSVSGKVLPEELPDTFEDLSLDETQALEKELTRKLDFHMLALLLFLFVLSILDRQNIASGRLGGLDTDLGLSDHQYQTSVAIMYASYLGGQIPSNIIITRVRPSVYIPGFIFGWGTVVLCTAWIQNYGQMIAVRLLLGLCEAPFFPGALLLMSSWYLPRQLPHRVAIMYAGNSIANGFGGLLTAGVLGGMDGLKGIAGWRWLYIIEGALTMFVAVLSLFLMADFPNRGRTRWLTDEEQRFAVWRMAKSANGETDDNGSIKDAIKDAVKDFNVYLLVFTHTGILTSSVWTAFFPTIMSSLGFTKVVTLLLTAPVYVFGFFTSLGNSFYAAKSDQRAMLIIWPLLINIVGIIMVIASPITGVRYTGMFIMCAGSFSAFNVLQGWIATTIPRTRTKRSLTYAVVNMCANSAHIYGAYFFPENSSPQFVPGGAALAAFAAAGIIFASILGIRLRRANKKATKDEEEDGVPRYRFLV